MRRKISQAILDPNRDVATSGQLKGSVGVYAPCQVVQRGFGTGITVVGRGRREKLKPYQGPWCSRVSKFHRTIVTP
jgi:hypothetical protein